MGMVGIGGFVGFDGGDGNLRVAASRNVVLDAGSGVS